MPEEREYLRELARRVAEIAASPENEAICRRWRDVNAMRRPDRAPVWCRPVGAWAELLPSEALVCQDPWMRMVERELRMTLIKHDIGDDTPVEGTFPVPAILERDPLNTWGVEMNRIPPSRPGGGLGLRSTAEEPGGHRAPAPAIRAPEQRADGGRACPSP